MNSYRQVAQLTLFAVVGAAYIGLSHIVATSEHPPLAGILLGLVPMGAVALATAWHSKMRYLSLFLCLAGILTLVLNVEYLRDHAAWMYFIQHAGAMILLGITFGSTLRLGDENALCSRVTSFILVKPMDANYLHYTWKVTVCWTVFFAVSAATSILLFFFGSIEVWSFFANLLTPLLLGVMFAGEYLIRVRVLPDRAHFSVVETIRAYREYSNRQNPH